MSGLLLCQSRQIDSDMADLARATPILQNSELGPGRNKIFIRGIADSSFNGPTQSTASVYFGDVQLAYSGADPGLKLIDMQDVEVMEGPFQSKEAALAQKGGVLPLNSELLNDPRGGQGGRHDPIPRRWRANMRNTSAALRNLRNRGRRANTL